MKNETKDAGSAAPAETIILSGHLHPITQIVRQIFSIFQELGFTVDHVTEVALSLLG